MTKPQLPSLSEALNQTLLLRQLHKPFTKLQLITPHCRSSSSYFLPNSKRLFCFSTKPISLHHHQQQQQRTTHTPLLSPHQTTQPRNWNHSIKPPKYASFDNSKLRILTGDNNNTKHNNNDKAMLNINDNGGGGGGGGGEGIQSGGRKWFIVLLVIGGVAVLFLYLYYELYNCNYSSKPKITDDNNNNNPQTVFQPPDYYPDVIPISYTPPSSYFSSLKRGVGFFVRSCVVGTVGVLLIISRLITLYLPFLNTSFVESKWEDGLVYCLKTGGACMIKLGQWAATRPDLFSSSLCSKLGNFHDSAPIHSFEYTKEVIRNSFGKEIEEMFEEFDSVPLASGAIAQVYRAIDRNGNKVAVKVRHPGVEHIVHQDLSLVRFFTNLIDMFPGMRWMSLKEATNTFAESMKAQLDLHVEALNLLTFNRNFADIPNVKFPRPLFPLVSERVLVETFEEGEKTKEFVQRRFPSLSITNNNNSIANVTNSSSSSSGDCDSTEGGVEDTTLSVNDEIFAKRLATIGFTLYLKMIFIDNFIHTDLHPGNILVREKANGPEVVLLDAGLVTSLTPIDRQNFVDLFSAVAYKDGRRGAELMITRSRYNTAPPSRDQIERFKEQMNEVFEETTRLSIGKIPFGPQFMKVLNICRQNHVKIDGNFSTLIGGLVVIEGLARQLNADFDLFVESIPLLSHEDDLRNAYVKALFTHHEHDADDESTFSRYIRGMRTLFLNSFVIMKSIVSDKTERFISSSSHTR